MSKYSKTCLKPLKKKTKKLVFKTNCNLMQVKSISCNILTCTKLPLVLKTFVLSIVEWPLKAGITIIAILRTQIC